MRADQLILQRGLAPSRSAAQRLIAHGAVRWHGPKGWAVPTKAGEDLPEGCELEVTDDAELRWVSRAGLKLDTALAHTGIDVSGRHCLDVGQSTGGFTEVLLARGAASVVGVDVGHGQLHERVRADARVTALEGINARHLVPAQLPRAGFDLVVADLSFISLTLVLDALVPLATRDLLLLAKPQFELQPGDIGKHGLVSDPVAHGHVKARMTAACHKRGLVLRDYFESTVAGGDGNREHFVWATKP
ncbi:MAG: TlyA family RNA methyltransferase [Aquincola sp.]|nr:TlyA family RNA methyltransferase [Aquincola sp.]MDH4287188.1 TlyA family RNA methyltransferase [Aquincola sp.]MDH5328640.1 TlyA family RNA methyltransferase [Aquincola sp.]